MDLKGSFNEDGSVDDIFIKNCDFHIEQMDENSWWIGIYKDNEIVAFWIDGQQVSVMPEWP